MALVRMLPNAVSFREFYGGYHGTCGETALTSAITAATAKPTAKTDAVNLMLSITKDLISRGVADANGSTTTQALHDAAVRMGWSVVSFTSYQEPLAFDWHSFLLGPDGAGVNPVVFEVAQAYNLTDTQGSSDEAGVHYHFICVVGVNADGYICCDGDNPQAENRYSIYSYATLAAAVPCGMLVLKSQPGATNPSTQGTPAVSTPSNTTGLGSGMAAYVQAHNITAQCVSGGERYYSAVDSFAAFSDGTILYYGPSSSNQVVSYLGGYVAAALYNVMAGARTDLDAANAKIAALQTQLGQAQSAATAAANAASAQVADLQAQLAAQTSAVAAQKSDPKAIAAEALVTAIAGALTAFQTAQTAQSAQQAAPQTAPQSAATPAA